MTLPDLPILLLAAGASTRMRGRDKLMEMVDGLPLLRRQAAVAHAATTGSVVITLPSPPHPRYGALTGSEVLCLPVPDAAEGMAASLRRGIAALPAGTERAMVMLADLPDLTTEDLVAVAHRAAATDASITRGTSASGKPGHPIVFDRCHFPALKQLTGDQGGKALLAAHTVTPVPLPGTHATMDLDTPEAWARWRAARA